MIELNPVDAVIVFCAKYLFVAVVLILVWVWLRASRAGKLEIAAAFVIAGITALAITKIAGWLYYDPRPFVSRHIKPLVPHGPDNGFPSEHTVLTMTLSALVYYHHRRLAMLSLALTLVVGTSRVLAGVHSPVDIVAGLVIGAVAGITGVYAARELLTKRGASPSPATKTKKPRSGG